MGRQGRRIAARNEDADSILRAAAGLRLARLLKDARRRAFPVEIDAHQDHEYSQREHGDQHCAQSENNHFSSS